ncbi:MAG TPA: hypothetical protein VKD22_08660, partial [Ramlibacter sp.]|nr:hypothetical protein [Ramlibacter sp.]
RTPAVQGTAAGIELCLDTVVLQGRAPLLFPREKPGTHRERDVLSQLSAPEGLPAHSESNR